MPVYEFLRLEVAGVSSDRRIVECAHNSLTQGPVLGNVHLAAVLDDVVEFGELLVARGEGLADEVVAVSVLPSNLVEQVVFVGEAERADNDP